MISSRGSESESAGGVEVLFLLLIVVVADLDSRGDGERWERRWLPEPALSSCRSRFEDRCGERCRCLDSLLRRSLGDRDRDLDLDLRRCLLESRSGDRVRWRLWLRLDTRSLSLPRSRSRFSVSLRLLLCLSSFKLSLSSLEVFWCRLRFSGLSSSSSLLRFEDPPVKWAVMSPSCLRLRSEGAGLFLISIVAKRALESLASLASNAALWLSVSLIMLRRNRVFGLGLLTGGLKDVSRSIDIVSFEDELGGQKRFHSQRRILDRAVLCIFGQ